MTTLSLSLLGGFHVELGGEQLVDFESNKVRGLLAYLAVESQQPHERTTLATLFWPDYPEAMARTNLRHVLRQLRQVLGEEEAEVPLLQTSHRTIQISNQADIALDVARLTELITAFRKCDHARLSQCTACVERLLSAAELYRGDFLANLSFRDAEPFEEWVVVKREQFHQQALEIFHYLATYYEEVGDYERARHFGWRQLELEPWREEAHQLIMRALALSGQRSAALAQYERCRSILDAELAVEPSESTQQLYEQIRSGAFKKEHDRGDAEPDSTPIKQASSGAQTRKPSSIQDWGEAPTGANIYGRTLDSTTLERWIEKERCRLVAVLGMGGIGKTTLITKVSYSLAANFEFVFWRSLLNAPTLSELITQVLHFVSRQQLTQIPANTSDQISLLLSYLQRHRCLLVFDNVESILEAEKAGQYRPGYADYSQFFERVAQQEHQSCVLFTSRERPRGMKRLEEDLGAVRSLPLDGLSLKAGQELLDACGISANDGRTAAIVQRYSGNPLALKLVARTIQELFAGDIDAFLSDVTPVFDDIRTVLDEQFQRLSLLEREILLWLAIEREGQSLQDLAQDFVQPPPRGELLEGLRALQRRSLLENTRTGFTLQNVVIEYVTDQLVNLVYSEIIDPEATASPALIRNSYLNRFALLKSEAKEYLRQTQTRQIVHPIVERLVGQFGKSRTIDHLLSLVPKLRGETPRSPGYAAGNLLNLLVYLGTDLTNADFSQLAIWGTDLRTATLHGVNFAYSDLSHSHFSEIFASIRSVAVQPGGQLLAAGTEDDEIRIWWLTNRQPHALLKGHNRDIRAIAFSPDGSLIASSGENQVICLWDVSSQSVRAVLQGHTSWVWSVAFSPDGRTLASGSADCTLRLWDIEDALGSQQSAQTKCLTLDGHDDWVCAVAFSPDGKVLASGSKDHTIRLWQMPLNGISSDHVDGKPLLLDTLIGHSNGVTSLAFSADGAALASGSEDNSVRLWDMHRCKLIYVLHGHTDVVTSVAYSPTAMGVHRFSEAALASGSRDGTVRIWDLDSGKVRYTLTGHTSAVTAVAFSPDGNYVISGSLDQSIRIWDATTGQALYSIVGYTNEIQSLAFSPDGVSLACGSSDRIVRIWDAKSGEIRHTLQGHSDHVKGIAFAPDGTTLASNSLDQSIRIWHTRSGHLLNTYTGQHIWAGSIAFTPAGKLLAGGSADECVRIWDPARARVLHELRQHTSLVKTAAFSHDARYIASGSWDRTICVWEVNENASGVSDGQVDNTRPRFILQGHESPIESLAFAPKSLDGIAGQLTLASGGWDKTVRVWTLDTTTRNETINATGEAAQCRYVLTGHSGVIRAVAFASTYLPSSGTQQIPLLVSASDDATVRIWDLRTGAVCHILRGHSQPVGALAFSPDGRQLATGGMDQTIKLWDVDSGECLQTLHARGRYAGMNIAGAIGLTEAQRETLKALGAVEQEIELSSPKTDAPEPVQSEPSEENTRSPILLNFPPAVTSFIGRTADIARLRSILEVSTTRLVTLVGAGGSGKTRLAIAVATAEAAKYADGACFLGLASLHSSDLIAPTLAGILNVVLSPAQDVVSQLLNWLREKEMLLVFDNFEHLLDGADLLVDILQAAPGVTILATSRQALDLQAEYIYEVDGLSYPVGTDIVAGSTPYPAMQLFQDRAARVRADFALSDDIAPAVARICQLVEGIPLAIELAATWVRTESCTTIAEEIQHNLDFLATNRRDIAERHRSLRTVFEGSWNLLTETEQAVLPKLTVFQGRFDRHAAEAVAGARTHVIASLVDKTLLRSDGRGHYDMHEIIRQYAAERLDATPEGKTAVRERHAAYYASLLRKYAEMINGKAEKQAIAEIDIAIDNIRAAWHWSVQHGNETEIAKFLFTLHHYYVIKGWVTEGAEAFDAAANRLLSARPLKDMSGTYWQIRLYQGSILVELAEFSKARHLLEMCIPFLRSHDDTQGVAFCLGTLGKLAYRTGNYAEAKRLCEESIECYQGINDERGLASAVNILGLVNLDIGDFAESRRLHAQNLERRRAIGDLYGTVYTLNNLGAVADRCQEYDEALRLYEEALTLAKEINYRSGISLSLLNMGTLASIRGDFQSGLEILSEALKVTEEINDRRNVVWAYTSLAYATCGLGDFASTTRYLRQAITLALSLDAIPRALAAVAVAAWLAARTGKSEVAVQRAEFCLRHPLSQKNVQMQCERILQHASTLLPPAVMSDARQRSQDVTFEQIVESL